jgi:archaellum biogenesis ATPase FlaH
MSRNPEPNNAETARPNRPDSQGSDMDDNVDYMDLGLTSDDLLASDETDTESWVLEGYFARGRLTLLTSQWKAGKTTLMSLVVARMEKGGELAGLKVTPGKVAVISEESKRDWKQRVQELELGGHFSCWCRPFKGKPTPKQWQKLIDTLVALKSRYGLDLVMIDSLVKFFPSRDENNAAAMMDCLTPLQDLTDAGVSVVLLHHPRKGKIIRGQAARGSGVLASHVDILIEMDYYGKFKPGTKDRRRWLHAFSRLRETPDDLLMELSSDGKDYQRCDVPDGDESPDSQTALFFVLEDAYQRLTIRQILKAVAKGFREAG